MIAGVLTQKKKSIPASITLVEHKNLTSKERRAAYKFLEDNPIEIFDEYRKKMFKLVKVKIVKKSKRKKK